MKVTFYSHNILFKYISIYAFRYVKQKSQPIQIEYLYDQSLPTWDYIDTKERKKLKMIALGLGSYAFEYQGVNFELIIKSYTDPVLADKDGELTYELAMTVDDAHEQILYDFIEAARETGKLAIGVDADQYDEAPGHILTSMIKRVDNAVFETVREVKAGQWSGGVRTLGLAEQGVSWVYDDRNKALIPDAVKATVDSLQAEIVAGRIRVPIVP